ncbi:peptidase M16 [Bacteroidia bacterium]|nr:peptidase M16 [Bacteroidia bacterium]
MNKFLIILLPVGFLFLTFNLIANPYSVKEFKLKNGLTVLIDEDNSTGNVFGAVLVKAGAKNDPEDATGIAHYFEHIMFKGTDQIGTTDYASEKVFLDKITTKYDELVLTSDPEQRKNIQKEISELSVQAAQYAIPNEVDVLLKRYGGANVNAGTSFDQTVYYNSFPATQIERWLAIYAERFRHPVFRLFQSELETVYEEKNRMYDNPMQAVVFDVVLPNIFKNHPYGKQPLIGKTEHLKNPSISKMMDFFKTYYVANNMVLLLVGNVNAAEVMPLVEKYFDVLPSGEIPEFVVPAEEEFTGKIVDVNATPIPMGLLAFRSVPVNHPDEIPLQICNLLLSNGTTGFIDQLQVDNKIMFAQATSFSFNDYGCNLVLFAPRIIVQTVVDAQKMIFEAINQLKNGNFSEDDLNAIKLTKAKELAMQLEDLNQRSQLILQSIATNTAWDDVVNSVDKINQLTKEDIVKIANQYFDNEHYLLIRSKMGKLKADKIDKPDFPVLKPQNTDKTSDFAQSIATIPLKSGEVHFVDFQKDISIKKVNDALHIFVVPNKNNEIFSLDFHFKRVGDLHQLQILTAEYLNYIGTNEKSYSEYKNALKKIGSSISFTDGENGFYINVTGFEDYFDETLQLLQEFISSPKGDDKQLKRLEELLKSNYEMLVKTPSEMSEAMRDYALYAEKSKYLNTLSRKEVKKLTSQAILDDFADILTYPADVLYCGKKQAEEIESSLQFCFLSKPSRSETPYYKDIVLSEIPIIYVLKDKKAVQSQIYLLGKTGKMTDQERVLSYSFNNYFGNGMSSLIFQEIREFRSLAYGARASVYRQNRNHQDKATVFYAWLQTQSDKTNEAVAVLEDLFNDMPLKPERLDAVKTGLIQNWENQYIAPRQLAATVASWVEQGYKQDFRIENIDQTQNVDFQNIIDFYKQFVKGKTHIYCIYGNTKHIDLKALSKYGKIVKIKANDVVRK